MGYRALKKFKIMDAVTLSADRTSAVTNIEYEDNIAIQATVSSSSAALGTLDVQVSLDYDQDLNGNVLNAGTWVNVGGATAAVSGNGTTTFNMADIAAPWIRLKYTRTSGTGTLNAYIAGKKK